MRACSCRSKQTQWAGFAITDMEVVRDHRQCSEKQALIDEIRRLVSLIISLHDEELDAALAGDREGGEQRLNRLKEAEYCKTLYVEMLGRHVNEHGC